MRYSGANGFDQTTELFFSQVLAGRPEMVRSRIIDSMESLGYDIIEDTPNIIGRRAARGWGKWYSSADVLDYAATLTIRFRSVGDGSTRVTFDYLIKHGWLNDGEKDIVIQEAKTIASFSRTPAIDKLCSVCEWESNDDSRFCRNCGAPLTSESAELEVLRLMAETRAAKTSVISTTFTMAASFIVGMIGYSLFFARVIDLKTFAIMAFFSSFLALFTLSTSLFSWNRLRRALGKKPSERQVGNMSTREFKENNDPVMLASAKPFTSITEGTTNLLDQEILTQREREQVPISQGRETKDLE
ncbi:MAG: zinc ribbon domain-containing protein [Acidobacteria bacterium]|nr:zinc ribbon domain-containing protein [Acidobacteriota bacterium]